MLSLFTQQPIEANQSQQSSGFLSIFPNAALSFFGLDKEHTAPTEKAVQSVNVERKRKFLVSIAEALQKNDRKAIDGLIDLLRN